MTRQNVLIALLFAATAAGLVLAAYEADRRQKAYVATHAGHETPALSAKPAWLERWKRGETVIDRDGYRSLLILVAAGAWLRLLMLGWVANPRRTAAFLVFRRGVPLNFLLPGKAPVTTLVMVGCVGGALWMTFHS